MTTISETGYARLIANFKILIAVAVQLAARFNPSKALLKTESMLNLAAKCDAAMLSVSNANAALFRSPQILFRSRQIHLRCRQMHSRSPQIHFSVRQDHSPGLQNHSFF